MYNRQTYEYREIDPEDYKNYQENANYLLSVVSSWSNVSVDELTHRDVTTYFTENYDIEIVYFDNCQDMLRNHSQYINNVVYEVSEIYLKRVSGFTATKGDSYKIFIQRFNVTQRQIFTLLHEFVHIFFHCNNSDYMDLFRGLKSDEEYPDEIIPFENEANTIASLLYLNDQELVQYLEEGCSFNVIMSRHNISKSALHNRLYNYLIYDLGLNSKVAFFDYLIPYKKEVYGTCAIEKIQFLMNVPTNFFTFLSNVRSL